MISAEERLARLEQDMEKMQSLLDALQRAKSELGSPSSPIIAIYLKADGQQAVARLTFDDAATPAVAVKKVR